MIIISLQITVVVRVTVQVTRTIILMKFLPKLICNYTEKIVYNVYLKHQSRPTS